MHTTEGDEWESDVLPLGLSAVNQFHVHHQCVLCICNGNGISVAIHLLTAAMITQAERDISAA